MSGLSLPRGGAPRVSRGAALTLVAVLTASCGTTLASLPQGPGAPATDLPHVMAEATSACGRLKTLTAEVAISGHVNGQRVRGRVLTGLAAPASVFLDAAAPFGASFFLYASTGDRATLVLPRDARVLTHGDPGAVLDAAAGVPLTPSDLRSTLTGCVLNLSTESGRQYGPDWRAVASANGESYFRRTSAGDPWRVVAVRRREPHVAWRADYGDFEAGLPRTIRLVSDDRRRFNLKLSLSQVEVDTPLGPEVFELKVPSSATPISLDELRRSGPFGSVTTSSAAESAGNGRAAP